MANDGPTSLADSPAYQHADEDGTPVPVASTIPSQDTASVEETALGRSKTRVCSTSLLHHQLCRTAENGCETLASARSGCCTNLLHIPSKRPTQPSPRPPRRRRPNPPGLIVRGTVFHVRVRVPREAQGIVGKTHVWRSLGTGRDIIAPPLPVHMVTPFV